MDLRQPVVIKGMILAILVSALGTTSTLGQAPIAKEQISSSYNQDKLSSLISTWEREDRSTKIKLSQILSAKGIQKRESTPEGVTRELIALGTDGSPLYYTSLNDPGTQTSRAHTLYQDGLLDLGLNGAGMEVGVWDAGIALAGHQEFDDRARIADGSKETSLHASLVTGNLISSGVQPNAKGVAYGAIARLHDWGRDKIEVAQAAAKGLLLSNHSYGILPDRVPDWYFGAYIQQSRDWDQIMVHAPYYLMVTAAGNAQKSRDNATPNFGGANDGFDLLLGFTTTKNGLTVAGATTEIGSSGELLEAGVTGYSSFGPMDDGRIKPDLAGDGSNILSTASATSSSYQVSAGTSMAAPGVTGSLLLLQQYHEELLGHYMKAATLKGLALHTADDVGAKGPDYKMGWGVINAKTAAELLQNMDYTSMVREERLVQGKPFSLEVTANGNEPLMVSLSWTDPDGDYINTGELNSTRAALVHDLDIVITRDGESHRPWKLDPAKAGSAATKGDNRVDPYERIDIPNASGSYTITISHKGNLKLGIQDFSLIVSGAEISKCSLEIPRDLNVATPSQTGVSLNWDPAEETLFELQYKSIEAESWNTQLLWGNQLELQDLNPGTFYQARVRSVCSANAVSEFADILSFEFRGEDTQGSVLAPLEHPQPLKLSLFPNPTTDYLILETELAQHARYSIVSSSGNVVRRGSLEQRLNVSSLAAGLYVLVVQDLGGIKSSKFYKN